MYININININYLFKILIYITFLLLKNIIELLKLIKYVTLLLSGSKYSTHVDIQLCFLAILEDLKAQFENDSFTQSIVTNSIYHKLKEYWLILDHTFQISAILNSHSKLSAFKNNKEKEQVKMTILKLTTYCVSLSHNLENNSNDEIINAHNYFHQLQQKTQLLIFPEPSNPFN